MRKPSKKTRREFTDQIEAATPAGDAATAEHKVGVCGILAWYPLMGNPVIRTCHTAIRAR
jgi:hypothetical protein